MTLALLTAAQSAVAATYTLRPDSTISNSGWVSYTSSTPPLWQMLDEAITQPTAPATGSDLIYHSGAASGTAVIGLGNQTLTGGEVVVRVTAWGYLYQDYNNNDSKSNTMQLMHGSTVLASVTVPSQSVTGWRQISTTAALTQAQVDDLRLRFVGSANPGTIAVMAAYATVETGVPPAPPTITGRPGAADDDPTPTWTFTAGAGLSTDCKLERDGALVSDWAPCFSGHTPDLTMQVDGAYVLSVRTRDALGLTSTPVTDTYALDRVDPSAPVITGAPPSPSGGVTPSWTFTGEPGATLRCELTRGGTVVVAEADCTSAHGYNLAGEVDGTYTFSVHAVDAAGNAGPAATSVIVLDRTVPAAPTINVNPGPAGDVASPTFTFFASGAAGGYECRLSGSSGQIQGWARCDSGTFVPTLPLPSDGTYTLQVRGLSAALTVGPESSQGYELDTVDPATPVIDPGTPMVAADDTPTWSFTGEPGAQFRCRVTDSVGGVVHAWTDCSTPHTFTLTTDGAYTFAVYAIDAAGNTSTAATRAYTLDRSVPAAPTISAYPTSPGKVRGLAWSFSGAGAAGYECRLQRPDGSDVESWQVCATGWGVTLAGGEPDGDYVFSVRGENAAGSDGPEATRTYRLDTNAPAPPSITATPTSPAADTSPAWSFAGEAGATVECRLTRGGSDVVGWGPCLGGTKSFNLSSETDGTFDFEVRATDAAGNIGDPATGTFTLDRSLPALPTINLAPASKGADRNPKWRFTGTANAHECRLTRGDGTAVVDWVLCPADQIRDFDLSVLADDEYEFTVRGVSPTGVRSAEVSSSYLLDTAAPGGAVITSRPGALGSDPKPSWQFTVDAGATAQCRIERAGTVLADWAPCPSPRPADLTGEPDGTYDFLVRGIDEAGNTGPEARDSYRLDRSPPPAPAFQSAPGPLGSARSASWSFTGEAGAALECRLEGPSSVVTDWSPCASPRTWDLTSATDGRHTLAVRAVDAAGNRSAEARSAYVLDTTAGGLRIDSGPTALTRDRTPTWAFGGDADSRFECRLERDGTEVAGWAACTSPYTYDLLRGLDGRYRFSARAIDPAGNMSPAGAAEFALDTTAPAAPKIDSGPDSPGPDRSPTWRFTAEEGARADCRVERGGTAVDDWSPCRSPFSADLAGESRGTYAFRVRATDAAGNTGATAEREYVLEPEAPAKTEEPAPKASDPTPSPLAQERSPVAAKPERSSTEADERPKPSTKRTTPAPVARRPVARPKPAAPAKPRPRPSEAPLKREEKPGSPVGKVAGKALEVAGEALDAAATVVTQHPDKSVFPGGLIFLVIGFLGVQNRIDRSDPKLALAPVHADPDLEFPPPPGNQP